MLKSKLKSQISLFVIIGVLSIVMVVGSYFLFTNSESDNVEIENDKVNNLVQECLKKHGENGITLIGRKGGFIYLPDRIANNPMKTVDLGFEVPIWQSNLHPTLESMEDDLSRFIEEQSLSCIQRGLREYEDMNNYTILRNMSVNTSIKENAVVFDVNFPIKIDMKDTQNTYSIDEFNVKVPNRRLKKSFLIANQIIEKEMDTKFLENLIIEQIQTSNDYENPSTSLPTEGMFFSCRKYIWTYQQLQENLVNINNNNFKYLHFQGTKPLNVPEAHQEYYQEYYQKENLKTQENPRNYAPFYTDEYKNADVGYNVDIGELPKESEDFDVSTFVPSTQTISNYEEQNNFFTFKKFEVIPSDGAVTTSIDLEVGDFKFPIPCIQIFHHLYSLDYAVVLQIEDSKDGFIFQFPMRVQIERNQPKSGNVFSIIEDEDKTATVDSAKFCSEEPFHEMERVVNGHLRTEKIESFRTYPLKILAKDKNSGDFLENVTIEEKCINLKCEIGQTQTPTFRGLERPGAIPALHENFSYCQNARIIATKEGYAESEIRVDVNNELKLRNSNNPVTHTIEMLPIETFSIQNSIELKDFETGEFGRVGNFGSSSSEEMVYVSVKANGFDFESTAIYPSEYEEFEEFKILKDPDLTYNLTFYYLDENYNIKGMLSLDNWKLDNYGDKKLIFVIPSKKNVGDSMEEIQRLYEYTKEYSTEDRIITN